MRDKCAEEKKPTRDKWGNTRSGGGGVKWTVESFDIRLNDRYIWSKWCVNTFTNLCISNWKKKYVLLWVMFSDWYRILVASNMLHIDCKKHLIWWQGIQHSLSVRALPRIYLLDVLPISFTIDDEIISRPIWYSCRFESMKLFQLHFHYTWFNHCMTKSQSFNLNHFYSMISVSIWNLNSTSGMILISMMKQLNRFYPFL